MLTERGARVRVRGGRAAGSRGEPASATAAAALASSARWDECASAPMTARIAAPVDAASPAEHAVAPLTIARWTVSRLVTMAVRRRMRRTTRG